MEAGRLVFPEGLLSVHLLVQTQMMWYKSVLYVQHHMGLEEVQLL